MTAVEANCDGLVGPTHSYAGLSPGNLASERNRGAVSNPRAAVLEGLRKMKRLADLGLPQFVLPPHERPHLGFLRDVGFSGGDAQVLERAWREAPAVASAACSASAMWAANAATVTPSADAADGKVHFTPANLLTQLHRGAAFLPSADVTVGEGDLVLTMDLPGLTADDLDIELFDGTLVVRGERKRPEVQEGTSFAHTERAFGRFERRIRVPDGVDPDSIAASMENGVRSLIVPKPERMKPKSIAIGTGSEQRQLETAAA